VLFGETLSVLQENSRNPDLCLLFYWCYCSLHWALPLAIHTLKLLLANHLPACVKFQAHPALYRKPCTQKHLTRLEAGLLRSCMSCAGHAYNPPVYISSVHCVLQLMRYARTHRNPRQKGRPLSRVFSTFCRVRSSCGTRPVRVATCGTGAGSGSANVAFNARGRGLRGCSGCQPAE
jgi:hypothetical protein